MTQRTPDDSDFRMTLGGKRKEKPSSNLFKYNVKFQCQIEVEKL